MDMRNPKWNMKLTMSGGSLETMTQKSLADILATVIKTLSQAGASDLGRADAKSITIQIQDTPIADNADHGKLGYVQEFESMFDSSELLVKQVPDESYEEAKARLARIGYDDLSQTILLDTWFGLGDAPDDSARQAWLNDSKAIRFRQLNSSQREFESAGIDEYKTLLNYCKLTYPDFTSAIITRIA